MHGLGGRSRRLATAWAVGRPRAWVGPARLGQARLGQAGSDKQGSEAVAQASLGGRYRPCDQETAVDDGSKPMVASRRGRYDPLLSSGDGSRHSETDDADSLVLGRASARPNRAHQVGCGSHGRYSETDHSASWNGLARARTGVGPASESAEQCQSGWFWPAPPPCAAGLSVPAPPA